MIFFFFVLVAHAGVWLLLNDILALCFPSSLSQKNTKLIMFGTKKCTFFLRKINSYCCFLFMKDFLNYLSHFSEDFNVMYSYN